MTDLAVLTWPEVLSAAGVGVMRQVQNMRLSRAHKAARRMSGGRPH